MKVVVQNASNHGLSRSNAERMLPFFPAKWENSVDQIMLCAGDVFEASFHKKERILSLAWPRHSPKPTAADAIRMLVSALETVSERGTLPTSFRLSDEDDIEVITAQCINTLKTT